MRRLLRQAANFEAGHAVKKITKLFEKMSYYEKAAYWLSVANEYFQQHWLELDHIAIDESNELADAYLDRVITDAEAKALLRS